MDGNASIWFKFYLNSLFVENVTFRAHLQPLYTLKILDAIKPLIYLVLKILNFVKHPCKKTLFARSFFSWFFGQTTIKYYLLFSLNINVIDSFFLSFTTYLRTLLRLFCVLGATNIKITCYYKERDRTIIIRNFILPNYL